MFIRICMHTYTYVYLTVCLCVFLSICLIPAYLPVRPPPARCGVPQGSVLGLKLYSIDTQLYVSFMNSDREERTAAVTWLNDCIRDDCTWLMTNMLKLNDEKMEVILLTLMQRLKLNNYLTLLLRSGNNNYNHIPFVINI